jgi:phosphoserine aminotransferase
LVSVAFETDIESHTIAASVFHGGEARLVSVDGFQVDVNPRGAMLFFNNLDKPGVLTRITNVLARADVNIAHFGLGRHAVGGEALGVLTLDSAPNAEVLAQIRALPNVRNVRTALVPTANSVQPGSGTALANEYDAAGLVVSGIPRPSVRPGSASFGSGPTKKRPGWSLDALKNAALGRSHRSKLGKEKLARALTLTREVLKLPEDYHVGIVPASDTGAFEMAMWTMLGPRPVDSVHFESFGAGWHTDATKQLKLDKVVEITAPYGKLPDLSTVNPEHDLMFTWNGTTSGVMVPNADFISANRSGLAFCDATSAVFSQNVDFKKCDVVTYSWQKVLGGEGAHGMLILSPRAVERLETYVPNRPLPKIFRMTKKGKFMKEIFLGETINTPSMLCVEDYIDSLEWALSIGGQPAMVAKANANLKVLEDFAKENTWLTFLADDPKVRSNTSVCLQLDLNKDKVKAFTSLLEKEKIAYDIGSYRDAPPGLRIWCGATVETEDLQILTQWLRWAYHAVA